MFGQAYDAFLRVRCCRCRLFGGLLCFGRLRVCLRSGRRSVYSYFCGHTRMFPGFFCRYRCHCRRLLHDRGPFFFVMFRDDGVNRCRRSYCRRFSNLGFVLAHASNLASAMPMSSSDQIPAVTDESCRGSFRFSRIAIGAIVRIPVAGMTTDH